MPSIISMTQPSMAPNPSSTASLVSISRMVTLQGGHRTLAPWYRHFVLMFENELRRYDKELTLPYWDWTIDAARFLDSPVFDDDYLGTYPV